jgi:hypothetical protein
MIKAIETVYKGYRFRSRLEARWAVFFDAMGIKWVYEKEGFQVDVQVDGCDHSYKYLPDFWLPESQTWVEVKGQIDGLCSDEESEKMWWMLDYSSPLDFIFQSGGTNHGLILLSDIPDPTKKGSYFFPIIQHWKGLMKNRIVFLPNSYPKGSQFMTLSKILDHIRDLRNYMHSHEIEKSTIFYLLHKTSFFDQADKLFELESHYYYGCGDFENKLFEIDVKFLDDIFVFPKVNEAFQKARSARFEHDERKR